MGFDLPDDYNDVPARIQAFRLKHPEGTLRQKSIEFVRVPTVATKGECKTGTPTIDKLMVVYTAQAFRYPEDEAPGEGTAAEFFPGKTPYTFDSEVQNAETAAWGRALIAVGAADAKRISSDEELRARQDDGDQGKVASDPVYDAHVRIANAAKALNLTREQVQEDWKLAYPDAGDFAGSTDVDKLVETAIVYELKAKPAK